MLFPPTVNFASVHFVQSDSSAQQKPQQSLFPKLDTPSPFHTVNQSFKISL